MHYYNICVDFAIIILLRLLVPKFSYFICFSLWQLSAEFVSVKCSLRKMIAVSIFSNRILRIEFKGFIIYYKELQGKFQKKKFYYHTEIYLRILYIYNVYVYVLISRH